MRFSFSSLLFGNPLPTAAHEEQRLNKTQALAVFSSDALSSVAYATEEILLVLVLGGVVARWMSIPIALTIAGLLLIVATSYYQTIHGYPSGGGAYIVARDNLGEWSGLIAAASLLIDYILTVAVSTTAGVIALTSVWPALIPWRIDLCLLAVGFITWMNLRGVKESGTLFAIPTYAFVVLFFVLILTGGVQLWLGNVPASAYAPAPFASSGTEALALVLILRAFSSGCTALTGVEAISNGTTAFRPPAADNAGKTLIVMVLLLSAMFLGITFLAYALGVIPNEQESVISQIGREVFGNGLLYLALQIATAMILLLAANTAFADFPRLSSLLARDGYAPRQLANLGDRLVFSNGIMALAVLAALLIVIFRGKTHALIPLYTVGVFLSFTLSQAGMVRHWFAIRTSGWQWKAVLNGVGAVATGVVLSVIAESKFLHGAWVTLLLIPIVVTMFRAVQRHYSTMAVQISLPASASPPAIDGVLPSPPAKVILPLSTINRGSLAALYFARSLSADLTAVVVDIDQQATERLRKQWEEWFPEVPIVTLPSPYRSVVQPLLTYLESVDQRDPERGIAIVVLPEIVPAQWWQHLLHNQTAWQLKAVLLLHPAPGDMSRVVISVPYRLQS